MAAPSFTAKVSGFETIEALAKPSAETVTTEHDPPENSEMACSEVGGTRSVASVRVLQDPQLTDGGHAIRSVALFDVFLRTPHFETAMELVAWVADDARLRNTRETFRSFRAVR
jgi:hypothetical protein